MEQISDTQCINTGFVNSTSSQLEEKPRVYTRFTTVFCGVALALVTNLAQAMILPLESRLGGLAYYDPNLDITWAADANINGSDTWDNQQAWVAGLNIAGVTGWRLPSADVNGDNFVVECSKVNMTGCQDNEMAFLYWEEGFTAASAPEPFVNIQLFRYWSGTEADINSAWNLGRDTGDDFINLKGANLYAMAVFSGDVGNPVPVPAAVWLFGSGLLGLIGIARRRLAT